MTKWQFRLLGPLEVRCGGVLLPIDAAKQRSLVAVLALAAGEPVAVERLISCLWGDQPPPSARNSLQNYVLRLRRALQAGAERGPLANSAAGYRLDTDTDTVDVHRFRSLVRAAGSEVTTGKPESAAALLDEALGLWRGEPLADVPSEVLHREVVPALVEQHLAALEQRIGLDLDLGRHAERISDLVALTAEHPLRERMWGQLMLVLYRSGRTAEALDAYRRAGGILAEELGLDPGPELRTLHQAILNNDPALTLTNPTSEPAGAHSRPPRVVPRQLPPANARFVGREAQQDRLGQLAAVGDSPLMAISAIGGSAGVGKTTLALHWGHRHADRFPDGQLYVNLRGFDPAGAPLAPTIALRGFLAALGVSGQDVPAGLDEQIALYRSRLAGRRMLVVLDNARDAEQVRPLLPGAPGCLVLVTSRDQLRGLVALDGAVPLTLDVLPHADARELLARHLGRDRVTREAAVVDRLIEACGRLPLALNIISARAAFHPDHPLAALMNELHDARERLDVLTTGEADVRAVFSWSYHILAPAVARMFRLLGLHPGPEIGVYAAASLAALEPDNTRRVLGDLARVHLITEGSPGRYSMHDLLRAYAADLTDAHDGDGGREQALRRLVDFYTHTAEAADHLQYPHRTRLSLDPPASGTSPEPLRDAAAALTWFDREHSNLLAVQRTAAAHAWHRTVWQVAWVLGTYHHRRGHRHDRLTVWQAAAEAAQHLDDPTIHIRALRLLGNAHIALGSPLEANEHLHQALRLAAQIGDTTEQARTHQTLAKAWEYPNPAQALHHATCALELYRISDMPEREASALNAVGWLAAHLGDYETAQASCRAALAINQRLHAREGEASTLDSLGYIAHHTGRHHDSIEYYQHALAAFRDTGDIYLTADTLDRLGHPHLALGQHEQARTVWQKARELYRQQERDQDVDRVQKQLNNINYLASGDS